MGRSRVQREQVRPRLGRMPSGSERQARRHAGSDEDESGTTLSEKRLGVGFIGSGFNAKFHLQSWRGIRDADVLGVWSPNAKHGDEFVALAQSLDLGKTKRYDSIAAMVADPAIDAIWL